MFKQAILSLLLLNFCFILTAKNRIEPNNKNRNWWNVLFYNVTIETFIENKIVEGTTKIHFRKIQKTKDYLLQLDLQNPMQISKITIQFIAPNIKSVPINLSDSLMENKTNYVLLNLSSFKKEIDLHKTILTINYSGKPKIAKNPPWEGGWVFSEDINKNPFISVACQGEGASLWYPCKDYWGDEPDNGAQLNIIVNNNLVGVGNGKLIATETLPKNRTMYSWLLTNPINNYNLIPYIGNYKNFSETYKGKNGNLELDFWVLEENLEKAKLQFKQVHSMLNCFENKLGPYPFYTDSYKLVESPYLGMEHQSNIAYGNNYKNGYLEGDISGTGLGLNWDYIIIHESGHEWFGNSITGKTPSDMWIHESFTTYTEGLYTACLNGEKAGNDYIIGLRKNIKNETPILNTFKPEKEGSGDMYSKGANIIHTFRQLINNDTDFYNLLKHLTTIFHNKTVNSNAFIEAINGYTQKNYSLFFNQYLKTTEIPKLLYKINKQIVTFKWEDLQKYPQNFPLKLSNGKWIYPSSKRWKSMDLKQNELFEIDNNFYIDLKLVE